MQMISSQRHNEKGAGMKKERKKGRRSKKPNKAIFEMMYYNPNMTVYEIAQFYEVSIHTIYKWASEYRKETA